MTDLHFPPASTSINYTKPPAETYNSKLDSIRKQAATNQEITSTIQQTLKEIRNTNLFIGVQKIFWAAISFLQKIYSYSSPFITQSLHFLDQNTTLKNTFIVAGFFLLLCYF